MESNTKNNCINTIFCILYFLWGIFTQFQLTVNKEFRYEDKFGFIINIIVIIGSIFCWLLLLYTNSGEVSLWNLVGLIVFTFFGVYASTNQYGLAFVAGWFLIILAGNINFKTILKVFLVFTIITLIGTIILNYLGIIPNFYQFNNIVRARSSLGFRYYSYSAQLMFYFICAYIVLRNKNITYIELIILEAINYIIKFYTNTRSPYILATIFIVYWMIRKISNFKGNIFKSKIINWCMTFIFPIAFLILLWLSFLAPSNIFNKVNTLLSGRLGLNVSGIQLFGIQLLGKKITFHTINAFGVSENNYNYIDSSYIQNAVINGLLFLIFILILFTVVMRVSIKKKNEVLVIALCLVAIHAMFDPQLLLPWYSPFCLLLGKVFKFKNSRVTFKLNQKVSK